MRKLVRHFVSSLDVERRPDLLKTAILYEANLDPLLRLLHVRNLPSAGWIYFSETAAISDGIWYHVSFKDLSGIHDAEDLRAPLSVAAFDIECNSRSGNFPMPCLACDVLSNVVVDAYLESKGGGHRHEFLWPTHTKARQDHVQFATTSASWRKEWCRTCRICSRIVRCQCRSFETTWNACSCSTVVL